MDENNGSNHSTAQPDNQQSAQKFTTAPERGAYLTTAPSSYTGRSYTSSVTEAPLAVVNTLPRPNLAGEYTRLLEEIVNSSGQQMQGASVAEIVHLRPSNRTTTTIRVVDEALTALGGSRHGNIYMSLPTAVQSHFNNISTDPSTSNARPDDLELDLDLDLDLDHDDFADMRMDIDDMTYEELLELEEDIGYVETGLSYQVVSEKLQQRRCCSSRKNEQCCICQEKCEDGEGLGALDCGHEFHYECIKEWLVVNNSCPVCKATGLAV